MSAHNAANTARALTRRPRWRLRHNTASVRFSDYFGDRAATAIEASPFRNAGRFLFAWTPAARVAIDVAP